MTGRNILSDDFVPDVPVVPKGKKGRNILEEPKQSLEDFFKQHFREIMKGAGREAFGYVGANLGNLAEGVSNPGKSPQEAGENIGYGMLPAYENLPGGIKEGVQSAAAGLTGQPYEAPAESNEYGASFGRGAGRMIGQGLIAAPVVGIGAAGLRALGVPALISGLTGTALGFGATTPGNALERLLAGGEAAALHGGAKFLGAVAGGEIPIKKGIKRVKNIFEVPKLRKKANVAAENVENLEKQQALENEELEAEKFDLESNPDIASSNPSILARKAEEARLGKEAIASEIAPAPEMNASQMPPKPLVNPEASEAKIIESENLLKSKEQLAAEAEEAIEPHQEAHTAKENEVFNLLFGGKAHRKRMANKLNPILEKRQAEVGREYDAYEKALDDEYVTIKKTRSIDEIKKDLLKAEWNDPKIEDLTQELESAGKQEVIPASKFVAAYRSMRTLAQKTRSSAYGKDKQQHDRIIEAADAMDADVAKMKKIIDDPETGLGEENLKELNKINTRYATEVAPLFKNKFYQELLAKSKAPKNMLEALTDEPYIRTTNPNKITGTQILNTIIAEDPELLHLAIGESIAKTPGRLLEPDELLEQFTAHSPKLTKLKAELKATNDALEKAKAAAKEAKKAHASQKKIHDANKKVHEEQKKVNTAEQERRTQIAEKFNKMETLNQSVNELEEAYKTAKRLANQKKLSLKEKMKLEKEAKKAQDEFEKANKDRNRTLVGLGALALPGSYVGKKLGLY